MTETPGVILAVGLARRMGGGDNFRLFVTSATKAESRTAKRRRRRSLERGTPKSRETIRTHLQTGAEFSVFKR
jgi:hypothetical protein